MSVLGAKHHLAAWHDMAHAACAADTEHAKRSNL